ncbi:hypothetical protein evm_014635 [Chilo suppressalis]|nr:hypothetical protein evm_014635 [Chilo suppressalis]
MIRMLSKPGSGSGWESAWRDQPRRAASAKVSSGRVPSAESSLEDLTLTPSGLDLSLPDCKIIANRNARQERDFKR